MRLRDLGENGLIDRIRRRFRSSALPVGIGDDAAVFDVPSGHSLVYCSDLVLENTHFQRNMHPAESVGYKSIAVNVSDIGAMGGIPMFFTISLAAPGDLDVAWIDAFYSGVEKACRDFDVVLAGGDTSAGPCIFVDVSMVGRVETGHAVLRSGARAGDRIYVTGTLGGSALGLELLRAGTMEGPAVQRHLYPEPRHRVGRAVARSAHAMIDISDGLSSDLAHIVAESGVSARIYRDRIPAANGTTDTHVLDGGEEYELLITAAELPEQIDGVPLACIGEIVPSSKENRVVLVAGADESVLVPRGWDHYRE
ncbi:MAG TPA: thiamine-phosphate kinase [Terriglobia bacterium]|nr:thiamine-phosphate kinase [Terriglobia bacterium]